MATLDVARLVAQNGRGRKPAQRGAGVLGRRAHDGIETAILDLQRDAGNAAVASLMVQRAGCAYDPGEAAKSRSSKGLLDVDVALGATRSLAPDEGDSVVISDFGAGQPEVKGSTLAELRGSWISVVEHQPSKQFEFVGYTDCAGDGAANSSLREQRAMAVARLFPASKGRAPFIGAAPITEFLTGNATPAERALNRAVVIRTPKPVPVPPPPVHVPEPPHVNIRLHEPPSEDCSQNEKNQLSIAFPAAKKMINKAVAAVRGDKGDVVKFLLERYFGTDAMEHLPEILAGYQNILKHWDTWDANFDCHKQDEKSCTNDDPHMVTLAYVKVRTFPWIRHFGDVHVCAAAFQHGDNMQILSATIVHELSHRLDNTSDHQYCDIPGCTLSTTKAIDNADSYAQFAREVFNATM